jgi:ABC-type lipoprotein export system ATPase subunit
VTIRDGRVAAEAVRADVAAGDSIVVGRGGWLRLPEEYLRRAGIVTHASARLEQDEIVLRSWGTEAMVDVPVTELASPRRLEPGVAAELRGVSKRYDAREVFRDVDARFRGGTLCAVTGPSGSGKTTLLHLLAGLELPDSGEVTVDGTIVSALDRAERAKLRAGTIAFVGQEPGLTPFLSARENVELGQALHGTPGNGALEALAEVGLSERAGQRVSRLSTGERGRVAIARALAARCRLILVDEPTSRLDQTNALSIAVLLARLARETGIAVVCASHDPLLIEQADEELSLG